MHYKALVKVVGPETIEKAKEILDIEFRTFASLHNIDYYCILATIKLEDPCLGHFVYSLQREIEERYLQVHMKSIGYIEKRLAEAQDDEDKKYYEKKLELLKKFKWIPMSHFIVIGQNIDFSPKPFGETIEGLDGATVLSGAQFLAYKFHLDGNWKKVTYFIIDYHS